MTGDADNPLLRLTQAQQHLWNGLQGVFSEERDLVAAAVALGAEQVPGWSEREVALARQAKHEAFRVNGPAVMRLRDLIVDGGDPLGEAFCLRATLVRYLQANISQRSGRTYAGGGWPCRGSRC